MNTFGRILTVGAVSSLGLGAALADDPSNTASTFGMGYGSTIGGTDGLSFRYGLGGGLALEGVVGYSDSTLTQTNSKTNGTGEGTMDVGVAFDYKPPALRGEKVAASISLDANYNKWTTSVISGGNETETSFNDLAVGAGMRFEYWPASWMSLNTRFGLSISPNGEGQQVGSSASGSTTYGGTDIETTGDFWGGAGATFWFR